jgi:hypothetical protein
LTNPLAVLRVGIAELVAKFVNYLATVLGGNGMTHRTNPQTVVITTVYQGIFQRPAVWSFVMELVNLPEDLGQIEAR